MIVNNGFGKRLAAGLRGGLAALSAGLLLGSVAPAQALAASHHGKGQSARKAEVRKASPAPTAHAGARRAPRAAAQPARLAQKRHAERPGRSAGAARHARLDARSSARPSRQALRAERLASRHQRLTLAEAAPPRLSHGQLAGLHAVNDPLELKSSVALVLDQDSREVLFSKNDHAVLPIASLTKLMTGLIVSDARLPLDEPITITNEDVDHEKNSGSRLEVGATLTRGELLHLALMSSENRAAHALGRTFPGGMNRFVGLMNTRAMQLGMRDTSYVEPTGLSSANRSSAYDLAALVAAASHDPLLRQLSTSPSYEVAVGNRVLHYNNTNRLVLHPDWDIGLQKTGYISEAGRCLVMQARVAGRQLIMVFLDSSGKFSRLGDAERVRRWVESQRATARQDGAALPGNG